LVGRETAGFGERIVSACAGLNAAYAATFGLSAAEYDRLEAIVAPLKAQGADARAIERVLTRKNITLCGEPLPGPTPTAILTEVRDMAREWLQRVEQIVA
jgi:hypothetical protein